MNAQRMSTTPDMKPIRAGAQEFREPLRVLRVDKVCRPIHPHLAGHLVPDTAPSGALLFWLATAAGLDPAPLQAKRPGRVAQGVKVRSSKASSARAGSSRFSSTLAAGDQAGRGGTCLMQRDYPINARRL